MYSSSLILEFSTGSRQNGVSDTITCEQLLLHCILQMSAILKKIQCLFTQTDDNDAADANDVLLINSENIQAVYQTHLSKSIPSHRIVSGPRVHGSHVVDTLNDILSNYRNSGQLGCLKVNDTRIYTIPQCIGNFRNIRELDMSRNNIVELPWAIIFLKRLNVLNLSDNSIRSLPPVLFRLKSLRSLNASNNKLRILPTDLLLLTNLEELTITGNPEMRSPTNAICSQGKDAIFESLRNRDKAGRQNLWKRWKPYYEDSIQISFVKPLMDLCIDKILDSEIDYISAVYFPPMLKNYISEEQVTAYGLPDLHKCSVCKRHFSNAAFFLDHVC